MRSPVWLLLSLVGLLVLGCNGSGDDDSCDSCPECPECLECPEDADGDGYTEEQGDCDDEDPDVHPRADEVCGDALDSDCSGDPDDGATDADGDGHLSDACTDGTDCDDANPDVHPEADDGCDGVDNDCDGETDDGTIVVDADGGGDHNTIQEGVDAAEHGDVVCVCPGTYNENVVLAGKSLSLLSRGGSAETLIEGIGQGSAVTHTLGDGSHVQGFTIGGGIGTEFDPDHDGENDFCGGGVFVDASNVSYADVVITANDADDGAGVYVNGGGLTMEAPCVITGNQAVRYGGAIRIRDSADVLLDGCELTSNVAGYGGALCLYRAEPTLLNCTIQGNEATDKGGAMYAGSDSVINLSSSTITENMAADIGGGLRLYNSQAVIGGCQITANTAGTQGGGIACTRSTMSLTMTDVVDNAPDNVLCDDCEGCTDS